MAPWFVASSRHCCSVLIHVTLALLRLHAGAFEIVAEGEVFVSGFAFGGAVAGEKLAQQFLRGTTAADAREVVLHVGL